MERGRGNRGCDGGGSILVVINDGRDELSHRDIRGMAGVVAATVGKL